MKRRTFIAGLGSVAAWPVVARAQQPALPVVALLRTVSADSDEGYVAAFRKGLSETGALADLGWTDGRNVRVDLRWAGGDNNRTLALAQELVGLQPSSQARPQRPLPSSGRCGRSRSSLRPRATRWPAASSRGSTA
jgi:putative ABC transport system substrate-binding protein